LFDAGVHFWCDNTFKTYGCLYSLYCFAEGYKGKTSVNYFDTHQVTHYAVIIPKGKTTFTTKLLIEIIYGSENIEHTNGQLDHITVIHFNSIPKKSCRTTSFILHTSQSVSSKLMNLSQTKNVVARKTIPIKSDIK
jgi:hypothetical protein